LQTWGIGRDLVGEHALYTPCSGRLVLRASFRATAWSVRRPNATAGLSSLGGLLPYAWGKPARLTPLVSILLLKILAHHLFFTGHGKKVHGGKGHESGPASKPVLQEQPLRQAKQPNGRIHGMSYQAVNAALDQLMVFAEGQGDGPVLA